MSTNASTNAINIDRLLGRSASRDEISGAAICAKPGLIEDGEIDRDIREREFVDNAMEAAKAAYAAAVCAALA